MVRTRDLKGSLEPKVYKDIKRKLRNKKRSTVQYETEKLPYVLPSPVRRYIPDFIIYNMQTKKKMYIEAKGYLRSADRTKMKAVKLNNPDADIRFVFARDNKLSAKSKTRYSDWAKKNGFKYCIGEIPAAWFRGF